MEHIYHKDVKSISVNRCRDRNFYIPKTKSDEKSVYKGGSRFISLNGTWQFKYYQKNETYQKTDSFLDVQVPMNYQYYGAGNVVYVNDYYLIDIKPPFIDDSNYAVYKKKIELHLDSNSSYYINFEGKDSCLYLYINQQFVGFDSVSHCSSEFDITNYLINGINEIVVFVYETCVGTYFECQDKFRLSGLTRDIYILKREKKHINAYQITYQKKKKDVQVNLLFDDPYGLEKEILIYDGNRKILQQKSCQNKLSFTIIDAKLWNGEQPHLYLLKMIINQEVIYDYLGFRFVEIKKNILYLNNQKIKLLGVNHHDSRYDTGYYLSLENYQEDLKIMQEHHINAIRTSHYPPAPEFLYLCDEKGMYVMDEADIECHGIVRLSGQYRIEDFDKITNNPVFKECIFDRIQRMMIRDFNRCCVISFSAGNEAGFGKMMIAALQKMKEMDSSRLIHYESLYTENPQNQYRLEFISQMYSSIDKMKETLKNDRRPLLLCEFSHAMGNSCGDIVDYVEYFYKNNRCMGGFLWEFNDHLFPIQHNTNTPGYGGDFHELIHSGNFCVDGLVSYKRTPHSSLKEVKQAFTKIKIKKIKNRFYVENRFDFISIDEQFSIRVIINNFNGLIVQHEFHSFHIKPKEKAFLCEMSYENCVYTFEVYQHKKLYSFESFVPKNFTCFPLKQNNVKKLKIEDKENICLSYQDMVATIDKKTGLLSSFKKKKKTLLQNGKLNLMRAPIDNDQYEIEKWREKGLFSYQVQLKEYSILSNQVICKIEVPRILEGQITYCFTITGEIRIRSSFHIQNHLDYLPRLGYLFSINKKFNTYTYLGYGKEESYIDKHHLDEFDLYQQKISPAIEYIKPQEYQSHLARKVKLVAKDAEINVYGMNSFSYLPYSIEELMKKKHCYELKRSAKNILCLDYKMSGIGSHSCGPELALKYKLKEKKVNFEIIIGGQKYANR